jgi:3-methyl-2-oxobutanoate hydroxymethyltransferase
MGGYVVQGKDADKAQRLIRDARALEAAGCYALVLECIPTELARVISSRLSIPTIGIGAGPHCDGQVLVFHDMVGLETGVSPKFVKRYAAVGEAIARGVQGYVAEVKRGSFPAEEHSFHAPTLKLLHVVEGEGDRNEGPGIIGAPV